MAAYPSFAQLIGSSRTPVDDVVVDRSVSGSTKVRAFQTGRKWAYVVRHYLSAADLTTLLSFYDTNRLLSVTLTWTADSSTATCLFGGPPKIDPDARGYSWVTQELLEQ